mmetsp:Transcript_27323/g.66455  ORF Transcript_27323/g.66455 Transcript_27323/m.66455 type:complete len:1129 (-) Transcript_27323:20-3406(-)
MDLNRQCLENHGRIQIVLVPLGGDATRCAHYMNEVKRNQILDGTGLHFTPSSGTAFKGWSSRRSHVRLAFSTESEVLRSEWDEFHVWRKPFAVVGIVHCPSIPNLGETYERFTALKKKPLFSNAFRYQCYAFEPAAKEEKTYDEMIIFPDQDENHTRFYITTILSDLVSMVLKDFDRLISRTLRSQKVLLTPADESKSHNDIVKNRRLCLARRNKHIADFCLLAGSLPDAEQFYKDAFDPAKQSNDWIWAGGAMEGKAACKILGKTDEKGVLAAIDDLQEAIHFYQRSGSVGYMLHISAGFKLARLYLTLVKRGDDTYTLKIRDLLRSLSSVATNMSEEGRDQILISMESAHICASVGLFRTAAIHLYTACIVYLELRDTEKAHKLLQIMAHGFHMDVDPSLATNRLQFANENVDMKTGNLKISLPRGWVWRDDKRFAARIREEGWTDHPWYKIHHTIIGSLVSNPVPDQAEPLLRRLCYEILLRPSQQYLDTPSQEDLSLRYDTLNRATKDASLPSVGIIQILQLELQSPPLELQPLEIKEEGKKNVFVFAPESKSKTNKAVNVMLVEGEPIDLTMRMTNILRIPISVDHVEVISSKRFRTFPSSFIIPPLEEHFRITISGVPLESGRISIRGVKLGYLGGVVEHKVDGDGAGPQTVTQKEMGSASPTIAVLLTDNTVVPPLPRATVQVLSGRASRGKLLAGERTIVWLEIRNVGKIVIKKAQLSIDMRFDSTSLQAQDMYYGGSKKAKKKRNNKSMVSWDEEPFLSSLPLHPGDSKRVPVYINAHPACCGFDCSLRYAEESKSKYERCHSTQVLWSVTEVLKVVSLRLSPQSYQDIKESPAEIMISSPRFDEEIMQESVNLIITLENSGERDIRLSLARSQENQKKDPSQILLRGNTTKTIVFTCPRMSFGPEKDIQIIRMAQSWEEKVGTRASTHVAELLNTFLSKRVITWHIDDGLHGLNGSTFLSTSGTRMISQPSTLRRIIPSPIHLQISMKEHLALENKTKGNQNFKSEQFISVEVNATSRSNNNNFVKGSRYQIAIVPQIGYGDDRVSEDSFMCAGSLVSPLFFGSESQLKHTVALAFMHAGKYRLKAICSLITGAAESKKPLLLAESCVFVDIVPTSNK